MRKSDSVILVSLALVFLAGAIIGQGFDTEVKFSDFIALIATLITFVFAWSGLRHNERIYLNTIRPVLNTHYHLDVGEFKYEMFIENLGAGSALEMDFIIKCGNKTVRHDDFQKKIEGLFREHISMDIGLPSGLIPTGKKRFLGIWASSQDELVDIMDYIKKCEFTIQHQDVQGNTFEKQFTA